MKKILLLVICLFVMSSLIAQNGIDNGKSEVLYPTSFHITKPLRDIVKEHPYVAMSEMDGEESPDRENRPHQTFIYSSADGPEYGNDPSIIQTKMGTRDISNKAPIQNWAGQTSSAYPPDPTGAVGPNHYIQIVNATSVRIYNKTGTILSTFSLGTLWGSSVNAGDPIVMYDKFADRWFLAQFDDPYGSNPNDIHIAISQTNDPTGSYYTWTWTSPQFPDYLKFSIWENGYYMTSNQSTDKVYCFERSQMLVGNSGARAISANFTTGSVSAFFVPLPADAADNLTLPTAGTPLPFFAYYDNAWGGGTDGVKIWNMTVNWTTPSATIAAAVQVNTNSFDASYNASWNDCPQPNGQYLDGIGGVLTYRAPWRSWTGYNSVVLCWGILITDSPRQRAIYWCELRQTSGTWSVYQQGIYNPDASTRWMGSIAMDNNGSIALCYAKSSTSITPGLFYTGRLATDALGTMSFAETQAVAGTGTGQTTYNRFGDYAHTSLDPDGITFWHTGEYVLSGSGQETRIYSFQLPAGPLAPVANFTVDNTAPVCTGAVQFTDQSSNSPTSWLWNFGDGQTSTLQNPSHTYTANGTYTVMLTAYNGTGNNTMTKTNYITINMSIAPTATGNSRCGTGTVILSATGNNTLYWWDAATAGNYLGTGTSYTTPSISTTTTYYVENAIAGTSQNVGMAVGGASTNNASYLIFDVYQTMTLVSVQARAGTAGTKTITLQNSSGTTIYTTTATVNTTATTITLNWVIPAGTAYRLVTNASSALFRANSGVAYPYTLAGVCSITGCNYNGSPSTTVFPSWFNWTVTGTCASTRVPCVATVNTTVTPAVSISATASTICAGTSVTFTASPTNGGTPSYQWKLNGGNVGSNSNTYTNTTLANGDIVTCVMTSTAACASPTTATSNAVTMTVNPAVTPSVSISASATTICAGTSVTFTPTPTNGGTPAYQWKVNGGNVGTGSTYSSSALVNGDVVTCVMTSTAACVSPTTATSNSITMVVNPNVTPSVTISASATTICAGTSVTFTPTPINGGTPSYQWKVNGGNVGTGSTYTSSSLANGNVVTCVMTSTATCASPTTATSNSITMTVNAVVVPSVSISASGNNICIGTSVTFTASPTNGGTPTYQWKLNGGNVGTGSTYSSSALVNGDVITCVMTSTATCASPTTATSNAVTMIVNPVVTPAVSISASATNICAGTSVTFTPTPTNGGTPTYQWKVNGGNVGTGSTYSSSTLVNNDVVTCVMTSTAACASPTTATSNAITITVSSTVTPSVAVSATATTICSGTSVTFTATPTNGGTPSYQWKVNGGNVGTGSTYTSSALVNGDVVTCVMTSTLSCASPATATSTPITMTVTGSLTPAVSVGASATTICAGTPVTFTATPTNGGTPVYQWLLNSVVVGTNSSTYSNSGLAQGDVITCNMTSSLTCASPTSATSNTITMTVNPVVTPSVTIGATATSICSGTSVTFTATPVNGGTPTYQWILNSSNVGGNSPTYSSSGLSNNDVVSCTMISSAACASPTSATSNTITITVNPPVTPSVIIGASATNICAGTSVTFNATAINGGTPSYQWLLNGVNVGGNSSLYTNPSLANGDVVSCAMTSTAACASPTTVNSNGISMVVNPILSPSVIISSSPTGPICPGASKLFTAIPTNGGTAPTYQWTVDGVNAGTGSTLSGIFTNGQVISCIMTSNLACVNPTTATAMPITISIFTVTPVIIADNFGTLVSSAANGNQWYEQTGGLIGGATSQNYTPVSNGYYYTIVTDINGCTDTSNVINLTTVGVDENSSNSLFSIFPNPTNGDVTITFSKAIDNGLLKIENAIGQLVYNEVINQAANSTKTMDLTKYAMGVYFIIIKDHDAEYRQKLVFDKN
jgi:PKD repeat protein